MTLIRMLKIRRPRLQRGAATLLRSTRLHLITNKACQQSGTFAIVSLPESLRDAGLIKLGPPTGKRAKLARSARKSAGLSSQHPEVCRAALLIVDEIGYLPVVHGGGNLFFQLVNARYEKGAMILTSNRGFAEWGEVFGDPVVATALLDRLLHHAVVIQIEGSSYRLRQHADLMPEHLRSKALITPSILPAVPRRRGRPPQLPRADQPAG